MKSDYTKDLSYFDPLISKKRAQSEINSTIIWQLESGVTKLYEPLKRRNGEPLLYKEKKINVLDFIEQTDNIQLLSYILNNESTRIQFKTDPLNLNFNKDFSEQCYQYINSLREDINIENEYDNLYELKI